MKEFSQPGAPWCSLVLPGDVLQWPRAPVLQYVLLVTYSRVQPASSQPADAQRKRRKARRLYRLSLNRGNSVAIIQRMKENLTQIKMSGAGPSQSSGQLASACLN